MCKARRESRIVAQNKPVAATGRVVPPYLSAGRMHESGGGAPLLGRHRATPYWRERVGRLRIGKPCFGEDACGTASGAFKRSPVLAISLRQPTWPRWVPGLQSRLVSQRVLSALCAGSALRLRRHKGIDDRVQHSGDVFAVGGLAEHDLQDVEAYHDVGQELEVAVGGDLST